MPKLHEVISGAREIEIQVNGVPLQITYDPNEYTAEAEAEWRKSEKEGWIGPIVVDFICRIVKRWDLEENDSNKLIALKPERVAKLSFLLLDGIMEGIFGDVSESGLGKAGNRAQRRAKKQG